MIAMRFVDTSILLYSISPLPEDAAKCKLAEALLQGRDLAVSVIEDVLSLVLPLVGEES